MIKDNSQNNGAAGQSQTQPEHFSEEEFDIWTYIRFFVEEKWTIVIVTLLVTLAGIYYAFSTTPIYRTDALLQVEETKSTMQGLDEISAVFGRGVPAITEIEIIRSRFVIGSAVDKLGLEILSWPRYFPLIGEYFASKYKYRDVLAEPFLGLSEYPWGGESLEIKQLDLPSKYASVTLMLKVLSDNRFQLSDNNGLKLIEGSVGRIAQVELGSGNSIRIFVQKLMARPGAEFNLIKRSRAALIRNIQRDIKIREKGRNTGILELSMEGPNPVLITETVNAVAITYLRQNAERRSAEALSTLNFLNTQLPELKTKLDIAESKLSSFRSLEGNINLNMETVSLLEGTSDIEKKIGELKLQQSELEQRYTASHPIIIGINKKIKELNRKKRIISRQVKELPEAEQSYIQLMRDVKVSNELYVLLLNKAQELKVVKAGTIGNVRIIDEALVPEYHIKPRKRRIGILSIIIGFMVGIGAAALRRNLLRGLDDPNLLEAKFGLPVYASILHSGKLKKIEKEFEKKGKDDLPILATEEPSDLSIEALRSFRTSLQFAMMEAKNNIIAISGPSPEVGKSFVSINLPYVLADTGKTVLVIDGDMRRGHIHRYYSQERSPGLSEFISGNSKAEDVVRSTANENVCYISSGTIPPNPSELLTSDTFKQLLEKMQKRFDQIIIDTPPILAVADGILISQLSGAVFLVLKSGHHQPKEVETMLKRLSQNNIRPVGFIFNDVVVSTIGKYGYRYSYYNYKY